MYYQIEEFILYEGYDLVKMDTLEEVKDYLRGANLDRINVVYVTEKVNVYELMKDS